VINEIRQKCQLHANHCSHKKTASYTTGYFDAVSMQSLSLWNFEFSLNCFEKQSIYIDTSVFGGNFDVVFEQHTIPFF
jgi:hypothetical protein